jgi:flagellar motor switch protein FliM
LANVLDQNEVDALLKGVVKGEIDTETDVPPEEGGVNQYDLTNQDRIIRGRMPTLEIINERFSRVFRVSLSAVLRKTVDISVVSTQMLKFGEFIKSLPVPTSLNIFKMEPLRGFAIIVVESKLVFAMVDSLFGGSGEKHVKIEGRDFSPIEQNIIKKVVLAALGDLQKAWTPVYKIDVDYVRTEVNPQFAAIVPPSEVVIFITIEVELEHSSGMINLCLPYSTIEPIKEKLHGGFQSDQMEVDKNWVIRLKEQMQKVQLSLEVDLGKTTISGHELMKLKTGDVMQLDDTVDKGMVVKVEGIPKFRGGPGVYMGNNAVKIKEIF